jgi:hypothetical protein
MSFERFPRYYTSTTNVATASLLLVHKRGIGRGGFAGVISLDRARAALSLIAAPRT